MIVAGIDVGSLTAKAVIMREGKISVWRIIPTGPDSIETAAKVMDEVLTQQGLELRDIEYIVSTGYGRTNVPFAHKNITEISCHAKGAGWFSPGIRSILDMGGQDCKAIRCGEGGEVENFIMNDKCAAGTGRYLERVAATLGLSLDHIGPLSFQVVEGAATIDSYCAVFAERDILRLLREGRRVGDILAGACEAIVKRIRALLDRVGVQAPFMICGGVAKNSGVVQRLERDLGLKALIAPEPQIVGAVGAALFAQQRVALAKPSALARVNPRP